MKELDYSQKLEIIKAVNWHRTESYAIAQVAELYNLLQMGVNIDINELENTQAQLLLRFSEEVQRKSEKDARIK